ncbi:MAG: GNAT family N-acetyltransferase [Candidatus Eisenbacteria bacterium]
MRALPERQPTLTAQRVRLRPFALADARELQRLAGDARVALMTKHIPHPYPDGAAESFIGSLLARYDSAESITYAIVGTDDALRGGIALELDSAANEAELGYWVAFEHWGQGIATEAGGALLEFAFDTLALARVQARHIVRNPASGRVMEKLGMTPVRTEHDVPWRGDAREDYVFRALTRREWNAR